MTSRPTIAYFSMEVAIDEALPTYSGGLGVLAGDFLRSAADLRLPVTGITLLYRGGYFTQEIDAGGHQVEDRVEWSPGGLLEEMDLEVTVEVDNRPVRVGVWRLELTGTDGGGVPVYFLDTDRDGNDADARRITDQLYLGDDAHRLRQEAVLGLGGLALLEALGLDPIRCHMNEGHSALLLLRLLETESAEEVRARCVFTTHTPVPAGHDRFLATTVEEVLGRSRFEQLQGLRLLETKELNMTELGLAGSSFVNGVSIRHAEITRQMFPGVQITSVTNGVHAGRWAGPSISSLFDSHLEGWRRDNAMLRYAERIPLEELNRAHGEEKRRLLDQVVDRTGRRLDPTALTIGIARRATPYKQTTLLFKDLDRLLSIGEKGGPIQVLFSGKAHPRDRQGKSLIEEVLRLSATLSGEVSVVFLEEYDLRLASLLVAGCDVWLNTPIKPNEASGTSGMKAAINGVPSVSTLDGWWIEGCLEAVTGWSIGTLSVGDDAVDLYDVLEQSVLPTYYGDWEHFVTMQRHAISLNASFFNTERMAREYAWRAYGITLP